MDAELVPDSDNVADRYRRARNANDSRAQVGPVELALVGGKGTGTLRSGTLRPGDPWEGAEHEPDDDSLVHRDGYSPVHGTPLRAAAGESCPRDAPVPPLRYVLVGEAAHAARSAGPATGVC